MRQLLFTHKSYDLFHSYIELIKYLFENHVIFLKENFFYVFIKNLLRSLLIAYYRVVAIVLFSRAFVVREHCNKNVLTFRYFIFFVNF